MGKLSIFNFVSLDGYYQAKKGDISWHRHGEEESSYSEESLKPGNILLFGRVTYEMMASYWPTPDAMKNSPVVAEGMNKSDKIVFSRTLKKATWNNTRLVKDHMVEEIRKLKKTAGKDITLLGSGSILTQLADEGLIDEYQFMLDPVALGGGSSIFKGLSRKLELKLTASRIFKNGIVLLNYQPMGK